MSDQEYQEYLQRQEQEFNEVKPLPPQPLQSKFYDIEDIQTETKKLTQLTVVYEKLQKDYQQLKQDLVYKDTLIKQLTKERSEAEKTLNDVIIHTEAKTEQLKKTVIEVPVNLLYSMAFDWSVKPQSVFVVCDEDKTVSLKTPDEMVEKNYEVDSEGRLKYRHWWLRNMPIDVKSGSGLDGQTTNF